MDHKKCGKHKGTVNCITVEFPVSNCPWCKKEKAEAEVAELLSGDSTLYFRMKVEEKRLMAEVERLREALEEIRQRSIETDKLYNESAQALFGKEPRDGAVTTICIEALNHKEVCEHDKGLTDYCEPCGRIHGK